jgi:hypothetical protein
VPKVDPKVRFPRQHFDFKSFRKNLREKKGSLAAMEEREVRKAYAPAPPEGWTIETFLEKMDFGDGLEGVAQCFESWEDFISSSFKDLMQVEGMTPQQRRRLAQHLRLFQHGHWPEVAEDEYLARFAGKAPAREGAEWTKEEDEALVQLAEQYDVSFGNPWLYISFEMSRTQDEVHDRYVDLVVRPRQVSSSCEFAITKAAQPLLMNRAFTVLPPNVYIVPSEENYPLADTRVEIPDAFAQFDAPTATPLAAASDPQLDALEEEAPAKHSA